MRSLRDDPEKFLGIAFFACVRFVLSTFLFCTVCTKDMIDYLRCAMCDVRCVYDTYDGSVTMYATRVLGHYE